MQHVAAIASHNLWRVTICQPRGSLQRAPSKCDTGRRRRNITLVPNHLPQRHLHASPGPMLHNETFFVFLAMFIKILLRTYVRTCVFDDAASVESGENGFSFCRKSSTNHIRLRTASSEW